MSPAAESCSRCRSRVPSSELQALAGICLRCLSSMVLRPSEIENSGAADPLEPGLTVGPGHVVGGCELIEPIGQGGMGTVFRARHLELQRDVAVKILHPSLALREEFTRRFHQESRVLAALDHPNIVRIHDSGAQGDLLYLSMEFVDGGSFRRRLREGRIPVDQIRRQFGLLLDAVDHAHGRGILHRDLKPDNLMLTRDGLLKVADFGLAKIAGPDRSPFGSTATGVAMGTPYYMAPEVLDNAKSFDVRSDIYSLGVILHELLTGRAPAGALTAPSRDGAESDAFDAVVLKALDRLPDRRFQTIDEFRRAFVAAPEPSPRPGRRAVLIGGACATALAGGLSWRLLRADPAVPKGPPPSAPKPLVWTWANQGPACRIEGDDLVLSTTDAKDTVELAAAAPLGDAFAIRFDLNYLIDEKQEPWIFVLFKDARNELGDSSGIVLFPQGDHKACFVLFDRRGSFGLRNRSDMPKSRLLPGAWSRLAVEGDDRAKQVKLQIDDSIPIVFQLKPTESLRGRWALAVGGAAREVRFRKVTLESR